MLMQAALADPRIGPGATVFLTVWQGNARARAFYRRHGFTAVGSRDLMLAGGPADGRELIMARRPQGDAVSRAQRSTPKREERNDRE